MVNHQRMRTEILQQASDGASSASSLCVQLSTKPGSRGNQGKCEKPHSWGCNSVTRSDKKWPNCRKSSQSGYFTTFIMNRKYNGYTVGYNHVFFH